MTSRYAASFEESSLNGPGDSRPTALQVIKDENLLNAWPDKTILITGTSSGIGIPTARALAATGARLFLPVRNLEKGRAALSDILKPGHVELLEMDMSSLASVRKAAEEVKAKTKSLNVLICNAGIMAVPTKTLTADGFESQFATNHLAHFLLFQLLKPLLLAGSTPELASRVVTVSSVGHRICPPFIGDYHFEKADYNPWAGYGQAKTANIWMANEVDRRYWPKIHGSSLMPGGISTGLQAHIDEKTMESWSTPEINKKMKNAEQGAATTIVAAASEEMEGKGGVYLEDCEISGEAPPDAPLTEKGYKAYAFDREGAKTLWADSCKMVGVAVD